MEDLFSPRTASTLNSPLSTADWISEGETVTSSMFFPISAAIAGAAPSNGTWMNLEPRSLSRRAAAMCQMEPVPEFPARSFSGFCFAYSRNSSSVFHSESALTVTEAGIVMARPMKVKSLLLVSVKPSALIIVDSTGI